MSNSVRWNKAGSGIQHAGREESQLLMLEQRYRVLRGVSHPSIKVFPKNKTERSPVATSSARAGTPRNTPGQFVGKRYHGSQSFEAAQTWGCTVLCRVSGGAPNRGTERKENQCRSHGGGGLLGVGRVLVSLITCLDSGAQITALWFGAGVGEGQKVWGSDSATR